MIASPSLQLLQYLCNLTEPGQPPHHVWVHLQRLWCSAVSGRQPENPLCISGSVFMLWASFPVFAFVGAPWLWNHPVFESGVQQSCGAGEHLQRASADNSGEQRPDPSSPFPVIYNSKWTYLTSLFMWPTVHPPRWRSEAGPGWAAGHRWGCSHPSPSGEEAAGALSGFHGLHHQRVSNVAGRYLHNQIPHYFCLNNITHMDILRKYFEQNGFNGQWSGSNNNELFVGLQ